MNPETLNETCFPCDPRSISRAREAVRTWLGEDHPAYEDARLAVSELVTNAVQHAGGREAADGATLFERAGAERAGVERAGPAGGSTAGERRELAGSAQTGPLVLRLAASGDLLRIEVTDRGRSPYGPRVRADPTCGLAESGRGLAIVSALSGGNWGHRSHDPDLGRIVWCEIPAGPASPGGPAGDGAAVPQESSPPCAHALSVRPEHVRPEHVRSEYGAPSPRVWWLPPPPGAL